jgi:uncharacterized MAPEG superfamily protein
MFPFNAGQSAAIILANSFLGKFYMTGIFRLPSVLASSNKSRQEILNGDSFKTAHAAQLNEAEWSPLFVGVLLYFHSQGDSLPIASSLAAAGSIWFLWAKIFLPPLSHVPGAVMRYLALGLLGVELWKKVF